VSVFTIVTGGGDQVEEQGGVGGEEQVLVRRGVRKITDSFPLNILPLICV
jgi:hypothetical protein